MSFKGYVQVYTGNGKGKTTAAIGLSIRALGAGMKVCFLQFMKSKVYSEHNILPGISPDLTLETIGKPYFIAVEGSLSPEQLKEWGDDVVVFPAGNPPADYQAMISAGLERARQAVVSGTYDLVVLDEINVALFFGLVKWTEVEAIIDSRPAHVELVLTGRGAPAELIRKADLVTDMHEIKHYYSSGIDARKGVDC
ncbi:MAG TPA: cob(I)yrinic acid a,c-diamide adenosyltransferase [Deltaproteobacteria bacterium]|nr:cob(I)yrinic acid a,c-diamide adenosyltransferase [Deltaproteobacteria bacterium]HQB38315.1 cob(I)yrinic acid a,c-diamide adenosyltransferase [Deltaproteobacteria bacterium]